MQWWFSIVERSETGDTFLGCMAVEVKDFQELKARVLKVSDELTAEREDVALEIITIEIPKEHENVFPLDKLMNRDEANTYYPTMTQEEYEATKGNY